MEQVVLLIHGPFSEYAIQLHQKFSKAVDNIVISGYKEDEEKWEPYRKSAHLVLSDDVGNPGPWNVNRQLNLVREGLGVIPEDAIVLKLRADQRINIRKATKALGRYREELRREDLYLTTNCFTRLDRLYHPSDMFTVGRSKVLKSLFGIDYCELTQLDAEIYIRRVVDLGLDPNLEYLWPESFIFTNFLKSKGWKIQDSYEDSRKALEKYTIVLNSTSIGLKWEKKFSRYVFPFTAKKYPPFFGGPLEDPICSRASYPKSRLSEFIFWTAARIDTYFWIRSSPRKINRELAIRIRAKLIHLMVAWTPPIILSAFFRSLLYRKLKSIEAKLAKFL